MNTSCKERRFRRLSGATAEGSQGDGQLPLVGLVAGSVPPLNPLPPAGGEICVNFCRIGRPAGKPGASDR